MGPAPSENVWDGRGLDRAIAETATLTTARLRGIAWTRVLSSPLLLPAILFIAFVLYVPTLDDWFQADDFWFLRASQSTPAGEYVAEALDFRDLEPVPAFRFYRPLYLISFRLSYELFGLNALGYHTLNVALYLGSVALVWFIAKRLTRLPAAASLAALLFALHPAYVETVAWIARGNTVMVTFTYLLSFLLFMKYLDGGRRRLVCYLGALVAFVLAILYHPTALSLAAVLPAYVFLIARKPTDALLLRSWLQFVPFLLIAAAMVGLQTWVREDVGQNEGFRFGWHQYARYGQYLGLSLFPMLRGDWLRLELPLPGVLNLLQGAASLAMIAFTLVLLARRRWPYLGVFAVVWLYISLTPQTLLAVFSPAPAQLYLPGASLAIFFVVLLLWAREALPQSILVPATRAVPFVLVAIVVTFAALGLSHQQDSERISADTRRFFSELRASVPTLEAGGTLYVVNAPSTLVMFTDSPLDALVELYYGEADVRALPTNQVAETERALGPKDRLFHYRP